MIQIVETVVQIFIASSFQKKERKKEEPFFFLKKKEAKITSLRTVISLFSPSMISDSTTVAPYDRARACLRINTSVGWHTHTHTRASAYVSLRHADEVWRGWKGLV